VRELLQHVKDNIGVEQTPRKLCLNRKTTGGAAHAGRYVLNMNFKNFLKYRGRTILFGCLIIFLGYLYYRYQWTFKHGFPVTKDAGTLIIWIFHKIVDTPNSQVV